MDQRHLPGPRHWPGREREGGGGGKKIDGAYAIKSQPLSYLNMGLNV